MGPGSIPGGYKHRCFNLLHITDLRLIRRYDLMQRRYMIQPLSRTYFAQSSVISIVFLFIFELLV